MLLKVCELFYTKEIESNESNENNNLLKNLSEVDFGKRWHLFENVSRVAYDDFLREIETKDALESTCSRYRYDSVHKILSGPPKDVANIFPLQCALAEFTNAQGKRELIIFNTTAYLCDDLGNTVASFPNRMLNYKKTPAIAIASTKWMNKKESKAFQKRLDEYAPPVKMEDAIRDLKGLTATTVDLLVTQPFTKDELKISIQDTSKFCKMLVSPTKPPVRQNRSTIT